MGISLKAPYVLLVILDGETCVKLVVTITLFFENTFFDIFLKTFENQLFKTLGDLNTKCKCQKWKPSLHNSWVEVMVKNRYR